MDSVQKARGLRRNMTEAEKLMWSRLRGRRFHDLKFKRQVPIGPFIVDFLCFERKLIIEIDGGHHSDKADRSRTEWLETESYRVVRFWNNDVLTNIDGVLEQLALILSPSSNSD